MLFSLLQLASILCSAETAIQSRGNDRISLNTKNTTLNTPDLLSAEMEFNVDSNGILTIFGTEDRSKLVKSFEFKKWKIKGFDEKSFSKTVNVQMLDFTMNEIESLPAFFSEFKKLRILNLTLNKITVFPSDVLKKLPNLEELYISHTTDNSSDKLVLVFKDDAFFNLRNLKILSIQNYTICSLPSSIKHLTSLVQLNLCNNDIEYLPIEIRSLPSLKHIFTHGSVFSDTPVEGQIKEKEILELQISLTKVTPEDFKNVFKRVVHN